MNAIYKYQVLPWNDLRSGIREVMMPKDARILCASEQNGAVFLWAVIDPEAPDVKRIFDVVYTGHGCVAPTDPDWSYCTTIIHSSSLVLHLYSLRQDWAGEPKEFGKVIHLNQ
jgi:hypothetical protein